jgi:hypothetical protein
MKTYYIRAWREAKLPAVIGEGIFDLGDRAADLRTPLVTDALDGLRDALRASNPILG